MDPEKCNYIKCPNGNKLELRPCPGCRTVFYDSAICMEKDLEHLKICDLLRRSRKNQKSNKKDSSKFSNGRQSIDSAYLKNGNYKLRYSKPLGVGSFGKVR